MFEKYHIYKIIKWLEILKIITIIDNVILLSLNNKNSIKNSSKQRKEKFYR